MGNTSRPEQWAAQERLRFIERSAYWRGQVNRQDLAKVFGISMAQGSADLQKYQEMNPGALDYDLKRKRYMGSRTMAAQFPMLSLPEAMAMFLRGGQLAARPDVTGVEREGALVDVLTMPKRSGRATVERRVFLGVLHSRRVKIRYFSVNSGKEDWRWVLPQAFGHDGNRWHVRAWCETRKGWRDFNLSRIAQADWPADECDPPVPDADWNTTITLRLRPHSGLTKGQRKAIELDFGMTDGEVTLRVRRAMENYVRARLRLPLTSGMSELPALEVVED